VIQRLERGPASWGRSRVEESELNFMEARGAARGAKLFGWIQHGARTFRQNIIASTIALSGRSCSGLVM
jgi:hypothetical protein